MHNASSQSIFDFTNIKFHFFNDFCNFVAEIKFAVQYTPGLGIRSPVFERYYRFLWAKEIRFWKRANRSRRSFVMSHLSKSLRIALL